MKYVKLENHTVIAESTQPQDGFIQTNYDFVTIGYYSENGIDWTSPECNPVLIAAEETRKQNTIQLEQRLTEFAKQKDIDISEIPMLLNSSNPQWKAEAQHFQDLYLRSWEAFYAGEPLPELVW